MTWYRTRITWLSAAEGGRQRPPYGGRYCTPARFARYADRWPNEAWSLVVEGLPDAENVLTAEVRVRLLAPESAPPDMLDHGAEFELFEGPRLVARGIVIGEAQITGA